MAVFSDKFINTIEVPGKGRRLLFDQHKGAPAGFGMRVTAAGTKAFVLRYNAEGRDRLMTIGTYPTWTLAAARKKAIEFKRRTDSGADILQARRDKRGEATVADVVERYCRAHVDKLKSAGSVRSAFACHVVPAIGKRKITDVRRREVIAMLEALAEGHPRQAAMTLGYIKRLFAWCEDREIVENNPVATLKPKSIGEGIKTTSRRRVLTDAEIHTLWSEQPEGMSRATWLALRFILATGQRPGEVTAAEVSEVRGNVWTIPAAHRGKTNDEHVVPLTDTALAIIDESGGAQHLFEHRGQGIDRHALSHAVRRRGGGLSDDPANPWRPHDLRRTMRTGLAAAKVPENIAELVVGHIRQGIVAVYDQYRYEPEKRAAMEAWERQLLRIASGQPVADNVVSLGVRA